MKQNKRPAPDSTLREFREYFASYLRSKPQELLVVLA